MKPGKYLLGDILKITSGGTPSRTNEGYFTNGTIPWFKTGDLKVKDLYVAEEYITPEALENCSAKIFPKDTLLVALYGATIGACSIQRIEAATNQACAALLPNENVCPDFLYFYFLSIKPKLVQQGVGGGQPNISGAILKNTEIDLPSLPEQQKIAAILSQVDAAREKRKQANALTEQFLQSTFLTLFGDPVKNEKGYAMEELENVCEKITDGTHDTPKRLPEGVKFITGKNIRPFRIDFTDLDFVAEEVHREIYRRCNPVFGDILYTNIGVNLGTAVMNSLIEEFSMKNVALLKLDRQILEARYVEHLLNNHQFKASILKRFSIGGAQSFLSLGNINRIKIPLPPLSLQQKFADIVNQTEQLRSKQRQSEQELEQLFQSLLQRYFG